MEEEIKTSENKILINGQHKLALTELDMDYYIAEGTAYLYVVSVERGMLGRSMFYAEIESETYIVPFRVLSEDKSRGWIFYIMPKDEVLIEKHPHTQLRDGYEQFIRSLRPEVSQSELPYGEAITKWYDSQLDYELDVIKGMVRSREESVFEDLAIIESVFAEKVGIDYSIDTENPIYNAVSALCDYLKVDIAPYRTVRNSRSGEITLLDIARSSHFITRKIILEKKWYKKTSEPFIGFLRDDNNTPIVCIPKNKAKYIAYNVNERKEFVVDREEAESFADEGYVIYQHLPNKPQSVWDVLKYGISKMNTKDIVVFFLMYLLTTLMGLLLPVFNKQLYDKLIPLSSEDAIYQVGLVIFTCMIGNLFFGLVRGLSNFRAIKKMEYSIVRASMDRLFRLPQKFVNSFGTSELVNRVSAISASFSSIVSNGISAVAGLVFSLVYVHRMFHDAEELAKRAVWMAVIAAVIMTFLGWLRVSRENARLEAATAANGKLYHFLAGIMKIKVSGLEDRSLYEFQKDNVESVKYDIRSTKISNFAQVFSALMSVVYTGYIYYTVIDSDMTITIGDYTSFNSAYGMFTSAVSQLASFVILMATLVPTIRRIKPIFEQVDETLGRSSDIGKLSGEIEVTHLDFAYEEGEENILKDINLHINPGEYVGIVGPSGSGKSTLLRCLIGFEAPTRGNIFYDDKDSETLNKVELRRQMGVVLQDGKLVVGNIFTNVSLSKPDMSADEAMELMKDVGLYDDIMDMPMGIFTSVAEGGGSVSGGQKQRILIARAIAGNPSILFMDEATSALDNNTQNLVCQNLESRNMTRIMIAHRLSTVVNCDRILVIDKGRIVEEGNYQELMDKKGMFYEMSKRQQAE